MFIPRILTPIITEKLNTSPKGVVLYGPRQSGKTTLVTEVLKQLGLRTLVVNADQSRYIDVLSSRNFEKIVGLLTGYEVLFIDEAQRVPEIGINLKIILDNIPSIRVIVTGSSSLDLASKISEPLTGRMWTYHLFPISMLELSQRWNRVELTTQLEERLIYGSYPEIFSYAGSDQKREYLQNLTDAYLYKDLLEFGGLKNSMKIRDLLKLVAFQVGSLVSISELARTLGMGKDTVDRYLDFLEKSYVIFRLHGFSRNLRKEIVKMDKIYFYDTGVRNTLVDNLKSLKDRNDSGQLWENFLIVERMKLRSYIQKPATSYFWRTHTGAELDLVEDAEGQLGGYEFKFGSKTTKAPISWQHAYSGASYHCINRENYLSFLLER